MIVSQVVNARQSRVMLAQRDRGGLLVNERGRTPAEQRFIPSAMPVVISTPPSSGAWEWVAEWGRGYDGLARMQAARA